MFEIQENTSGEIAEMMRDITTICGEISLTAEPDKIHWKLGKKGFTVSSLYKHLKVNAVDFPQKFLWKVKLPQKIKVFLWLLLKNSILMKDNL